MIGTGIFLFASNVARQCRDPWTILLAWVLGAVVAGCGALCLAELAAAYPKTGGIYVFLRHAYGPGVAFLYAWCKFCIMRVASFAIPALFFADFFGECFGLTAKEVAIWDVPIALVVVNVLTVVNVLGVRAGGVVQTVFTAAKVAVLVAIVGVGVAFLCGALSPHVIAVEAPPSLPQRPWWLLLGTALVPVLWSYGGWDESPFVAEEVKNPTRNLPLSILGGLAVVAVLYVCVNAAYLGVLSPPELAASEGKTVVLAMQRALGPWSGVPLSIALMISTFGAANGMALTGARIAFAAGRDQPLAGWFGAISPLTRTPVRALLVQCLLADLAIVLMPDPMTLLYFTGLAYWLFAALTGAAVFVMRWRDPQTTRPFRVWAYPLTPLLFIAAALAMAATVVNEDPKNAKVTLYILGVGTAFYVFQRLWMRRAISR